MPNQDTTPASGATGGTAPLDLDALARELGADLGADPYPLWAELAARGPIHWVRLPAVPVDCWLVTDPAAARAALTDPRLRNDLRHSAGWTDDGGHSVGRNLLQVDRPTAPGCGGWWPPSSPRGGYGRSGPGCRRSPTGCSAHWTGRSAPTSPPRSPSRCRSPSSAS